MKYSKTSRTFFCLAWAMLLFLSITRWDVLKSVQVQEVWKTIKDSGIGDAIGWNAGYFLLFCLMVIFLVLCLRHGRKQYVGNHFEEEQERRRRERLHSPAYSSLGGNIHYNYDQYTPDKVFDEK